MTDQKDVSDGVEETTPGAGNNAEASRTTQSRKNGGMVLSAVAIVIAPAIGAGLYINSKQLADRQTEATQSLNDRLDKLQQQSGKEQQQLTQQLEAARQTLQEARTEQSATQKELETLRNKVASISDSDTRSWLLAQADYMVKLAGRKLWNDQDVTSAAALLKGADASLADMNDPSLLEIRRALTADIGALSAISQVDYDGIILKLNQLSNGIDNLRLADNDSDAAPMDANSGELSTSWREWRQNLVKSWHNFMDSFITIRRRDNTAQPLLAPNQDVYLRENIRSRLLIAAQAVPRHQDEVYKQSIDTVSAWVRARYDTSDASTKAFLDQLDELSQQDISMDLPDQLESQPLLDKVMQTRVRNLLAQPSAPATQQGG